MSDAALDVVEFLLTTSVYSDDRTLDENDLPPSFRRVYWTGGVDDENESDDGSGGNGGSTRKPAGISRPLSVTTSTAREATGVGQPWDAVADLMFTERDEFSGTITLAQRDMAEEWFVERVDDERLLENPTLAKHFAEHETYDVDVTHEEARDRNRPIQADRVWIDGLLDEYFNEDDDEEMLDLVEVRAPPRRSRSRSTTSSSPRDQENELDKISKAIEHRDYLADIGLREIGKLLFVGRPAGDREDLDGAGAGRDMDLPFVEVKLSMITSQYLGETAKNVDKTFEVAKRLSPCILFIDEFDFVAKTRRSDEHALRSSARSTRSSRASITSRSSMTTSCLSGRLTTPTS